MYIQVHSRVHSKILLRSILSIAVQCNALCNIHCNAEIRHIIPKFYSRAVILLRSSFATVDIIPNNLVFSYVILLWSSELQPKLQRTLMTSFQKFAPEQWFCSGAIVQQLTSFLNFCSGAVQCNANCDALCCLEWTLLNAILHLSGSGWIGLFKLVHSSQSSSFYIGQRRISTLREQSDSTKRALREHSESYQSITIRIIPSEPKISTSSCLS